MILLSDNPIMYIRNNNDSLNISIPCNNCKYELERVVLKKENLK